MSTTDQFNVLSDGYLSDTTIEAELFAFGQKRFDIIHISYDDMEGATKQIMSLKGRTVCLSGPASFSYERAVIFSLLNRSHLIEDGYPYLSTQSFKPGKWSWVSASACVNESASIGAMSMLLAEVSVQATATIGNFCWLGERTSVGMAAKMAGHSTLLNGCHLGTGAHVKRHSEISTNINSGQQVSGLIDTNFFGAQAFLHL